MQLQADSSILNSIQDLLINTKSKYSSNDCKLITVGKYCISLSKVSCVTLTLHLSDKTTDWLSRQGNSIVLI